MSKKGELGVELMAINFRNRSIISGLFKLNLNLVRGLRIDVIKMLDGVRSHLSSFGVICII